MTAIERFEALMLEHEVGEQKVSLDKARQLLLNIAKKMEEIERLNTLLAEERKRSNGLSDRWATVRTLCGAEADDTVVEVYNRIKHARNVVQAASDLGLRRTMDARAERL